MSCPTAKARAPIATRALPPITAIKRLHFHCGSTFPNPLKSVDSRRAYTETELDPDCEVPVLPAGLNSTCEARPRGRPQHHLPVQWVRSATVRSSERPASRRDHWGMGRPLIRVLEPSTCHFLRPAGGRVLPRLLASVHGEIHQRVAVVHCLDAAAGRPVRLEDAVTVAQVAHDVHHARRCGRREARRARGAPSTTACPSP